MFSGTGRNSALEGDRMRRKSNKFQPEYWFAGGLVLAGLALMAQTSGLSTIAASWLLNKPDPETCLEKVQSSAVLSRDQLSRLLTIPERDRKERVRTIVQAPYCRLPNVEVRAGVVAEREAYPLEFDPQVWLIVLYEGDEYVGYAFSFRQ